MKIMDYLEDDLKQYVDEMMDNLYQQYVDEFNWSRISFSNKSFVEELKRELDPGDVFLSGAVYAVAKCDSNDDVLYLGVDGLDARELWRIYHLTYSSHNTDGFPRYVEFYSREEVAEYIQDQFASGFQPD